MMFDKEAQIRASDGTYIRSEYVTQLTKVNLIEVLHRKELVPMNVTVGPLMKSKPGSKPEKEASLFELKFLPVDQQPWISYLGASGDSVYRTRH